MRDDPSALTFANITPYLFDRYEFISYGHAAELLGTSFHDEWQDIKKDYEKKQKEKPSGKRQRRKHRPQLLARSQRRPRRKKGSLDCEEALMYNPLPVSYPLPEYVLDAIQALLDYLNAPGDHTSDDIYRAEVQLALRDAYAAGRITEREWEELKDYYVWRGYDKQ